MIGKYLVIRPVTQGSVEDEWRQCLKQIILKRGNGGRLIKLNIFIDSDDYRVYLSTAKDIGKSVSETFGNECPAYNISVHPPEKPWKVLVEAGYTNVDAAAVVTKTWESIPYVVCTTDSGKEVWAGGLGLGHSPSDTRGAAEVAFNQMKAILEQEEMTFNHIVRQWNYIGSILEIKNGFQNYQVFNEVRSEYYHKYRNVHGYPAATGIGLQLGGVTIDFCAVLPDEAVMVKPVDNPDQVNAYEYGQKVLRGMPCGGTSVKHPPQFERALLLTRKVKSTLFISGTASIKGQDTIGPDDVEMQTRVTIENISRLTDEKRIRKMTGGSADENGEFILIRTYIKRQEDFGKVRAICAEKFLDVPQVFIESDICRDDLLVEIEAEYLINH